MQNTAVMFGRFSPVFSHIYRRDVERVRGELFLQLIIRQTLLSKVSYKWGMHTPRAIGAQCLVQRCFDMWIGGAKDKTANPVISRQPSLQQHCISLST